MLIEELRKRRLMNTLISPHSCETYKQCTRYVFAGFFFTHLISRHSYLVYRQRDSHATSQTAIYANNITQTGRIRYIVDGFGSFWLVLLVVLGGFGWVHVLVTAIEKD